MLKMYLCGVRGVEGGGVKEDEVGEYLYEAAWRCTQWGEESMHGVSVEVQREGYHQKVYKCMTALGDGQMNLLQNSLTEARYVNVHMKLNYANLTVTPDAMLSDICAQLVWKAPIVSIPPSASSSVS